MKKVMSGMRCEKFIFLVSIAVMLVAAQSWGATLADYDGSYAGSYSGGDEGVWIALHDDANDLHGLLMLSTDDGMPDFGEFEDLGEKEEGVRWFGVKTEISDTGIEASFTLSTGAVTGVWENEDDGEDGEITGGLITGIPFSGSYSGTFTIDDSDETPTEKAASGVSEDEEDESDESGEATGTWEMTIAANGRISGTATITGLDDDEDISTATLIGGAHPDGYIIAVGLAIVGEGDEEPVSIFYGTVEDGTASGSYMGEGGEGTFTGTIESTSDDSTDDSSDSGSCFISSILNK